MLCLFLFVVGCCCMLSFVVAIAVRCSLVFVIDECCLLSLLEAGCEFFVVS